MFSKTCEYGIKAVIHVAKVSQKGERVGLKDIAKAIDSPEAFTAKIMQQLSRASIVTSIKGPTGGFEMSENDRVSTTLSAVVQVIDGDGIIRGCGLGLKECNEVNPCPLHNQFAMIQSGIKNMLEHTTIEALANKLDGGIYVLK